MRIVLDIDGVLSNFNDPFALLLRSFGADLRPFEAPERQPTIWDWPQEYGATREQERTAWDYAEEHPEWWGNLPVHPDMDALDARQLVKAVVNKHEVTFVTSRPCGRDATSWWLQKEFGVPRTVPTILCFRSKAAILEGMDPQIVVEDRLPTLQAWLNKAWVGGFGWLVDRPYNRTNLLHPGLVIKRNSQAAFEDLLS